MSEVPTTVHSHSAHHHHHHDHVHPTQEAAHDFVAANANHFNENAQKFEEYPFAKELTQRQTTAYLGAYPFNEDKTVMMDFACGPGLVSRELASYTKQIVGVDISQGLVDEFNKRVNNQGIAPEEMKAICVHLKGEEGELDGTKFDVIICGMAYHHIPCIDETTKILAFFLKPGGVLLVTEMLKEEGSEAHLDKAAKPGWEHIVAHRGGFTAEELRRVFEGAGLGFEMNIMAKAKHHGYPTRLILARGVKA